MPDIVSSEVRSRMMSGIRATNTKPELAIRSGLHRAGFRFRIHGALPGKPDIVLPRFNAVIFIHGCFWHGHNCHLFRVPSTRTEFWRAKIAGNCERDKKVQLLLRSAGWRVLNVWECAVKGKTRLEFTSLISDISKWLNGRALMGDIGGRNVERK